MTIVRIAPREIKLAKERLREHWATEAADSGLRSFALTGMPRVESSMEREISDHRHGFRSGGGSASEHSLMHAVLADGLAHLAPTVRTHTVAVLYAALGPQRKWHHQVRSALLRGTSRVKGLAEDELGAALLTERVQDGLRNGEHAALVERKPQRKTSSFENEFRKNSGVRVWLPARCGQVNIVEVVIEQTRELLRPALEDLVLAIRQLDSKWRDRVYAKQPRIRVVYIPERLI